MGKFSSLIICLFIFSSIFSQRKDFHPNMAAYTTTRIVGLKFDYLKDGKKIYKTSTGTGFFYEFDVDSSKIQVIVTNHHVIKGCETGKMTFSESESSLELGKKPKTHLIEINDFESKWIIHPNEDLAIMPIDLVSKNFFQKYGTEIKKIWFNSLIIPSLRDSIKISDIERVLMIGYPNGTWDSTNNLPVIRQGITATSFFSNFNGKNRFLIDIPTFHGSSGSPIVMYSFDPYFTSKDWVSDEFRTYLLGIVSDAYFYNAEGAIVPGVIDSSLNSVKVKTLIPFNIAIAIKAEKLFEFVPLLKTYMRKQKL